MAITLRLAAIRSIVHKQSGERVRVGWLTFEKMPTFNITAATIFEKRGDVGSLSSLANFTVLEMEQVIPKAILDFQFQNSFSRPNLNAGSEKST